MKNTPNRAHELIVLVARKTFPIEQSPFRSQWSHFSNSAVAMKNWKSSVSCGTRNTLSGQDGKALTQSLRAFRSRRAPLFESSKWGLPERKAPTIRTFWQILKQKESTKGNEWPVSGGPWVEKPFSVREKKCPCRCSIDHLSIHWASTITGWTSLGPHPFAHSGPKSLDPRIWTPESEAPELLISDLQNGERDRFKMVFRSVKHWN